MLDGEPGDKSEEHARNQHPFAPREVKHGGGNIRPPDAGCNRNTAGAYWMRSEYASR